MHRRAAPGAPGGRGRGVRMGASGALWVARLRPPAGRSIDDLLELPLSLDVWQREENALVAVASEHTLRELERRRLAHVERISTREEYHRRAEAAARPPSDPTKR